MNSKKLTTQAIGILLVIHTPGDFYEMNYSLQHTGNSDGGILSYSARLQEGFCLVGLL